MSVSHKVLHGTNPALLVTEVHRCFPAGLGADLHRALAVELRDVEVVG
jgi:hypothetical protein